MSKNIEVEKNYRQSWDLGIFRWLRLCLADSIRLVSEAVSYFQGTQTKKKGAGMREEITKARPISKVMHR